MKSFVLVLVWSLIETCVAASNATGVHIFDQLNSVMQIHSGSSGSLISAIQVTQKRAEDEAITLQAQCDALNRVNLHHFSVGDLHVDGTIRVRQGRCNSTKLTEEQLNQIELGVPLANRTLSLRFGIVANITTQPRILNFSTDDNGTFHVILPSNASSLYCIVDEDTLASEQRWLSLSNSMPLLQYTNALNFDRACLESRWSTCTAVWNVTRDSRATTRANLSIRVDRACQRSLPCLVSTSNSTGNAATAATYTTMAFVASLISSILNLLAALLWLIGSAFSIAATIFAYLSAVSAAPELYGFSNGPSSEAFDAASSLSMGAGRLLFGAT